MVIGRGWRRPLVMSTPMVCRICWLAHDESDNGERAGKIYRSVVLTGSDTDLGNLASFVGETPGDWLGYTVGYAGDTNGDGVAGLLMAGLHHQNDRGAVYLVNGSSGLDRQGQNVAELADLKPSVRKR